MIVWLTIEKKQSMKASCYERLYESILGLLEYKTLYRKSAFKYQIWKNEIKQLSKEDTSNIFVSSLPFKFITLAFIFNTRFFPKRAVWSEFTLFVFLQLPLTQNITNVCLKMDSFEFEPVHEISNNVECATSKASDQPAHTRSLIRAFASRLSFLWLLSYWLNTIWSF